MEEPFVVDTALKIGINYNGTAHTQNKHVNLDSNTEVDQAYIPRQTTRSVLCSKRNSLCVSVTIMIAITTLFAVLHAYGHFSGIHLTLNTIGHNLYKSSRANGLDVYYL